MRCAGKVRLQCGTAGDLDVIIPNHGLAGAGSGDGEADGVNAGIVISMCRIDIRAGGVVAKVPQIGGDGAGGSIGELNIQGFDPYQRSG